VPLDGASVKVAGLADLRRELRKLDDAGLIDQLKDANWSIASHVVARARSRAAALGKMEAKAAGSLTASRAAARAQVSGGGSKAPFFGGAEFGSGRGTVRNTTRGLVRGWNQFAPWTGSGSGAGRFLYAAIRADADMIADTYLEAITKITARAFPE